MTRKSTDEWEIKFLDFPYYLTITAKHDKAEDLVKVVIHSRIHVKEEQVMPHQWSCGFVRDRYRQFLGDVKSYVIKTYGLKLQLAKYM